MRALRDLPSVDRLLEIMEEADSAEDLLAVETTLSERQADLEALTAQREALSDQVALSTLHLQLVGEAPREVEADGFLGGLQTGWNGLVSTLNALLVTAGALLPWLLVLLPPAALLLWALRRRRRRRSAPGTAAETVPDAVVETAPEAEGSITPSPETR